MRGVLKSGLLNILEVVATIHSLRRRHAASLKYVGWALAINPRHPDVLQLAAKVHLRAGHVSQALHFADRITTLYPDKPVSWLDKGSILYDIGAYEEAAQCFERVINLGVDDPPLLVMLGRAQSGAGRLVEAERAFRAALERQPLLCDAALGLASCLFQTGKTKEAFHLYHELLRRAPKSAALHRDRAWALLESRQHSEAEEAAEEAVRLRPEWVDGWQILALARVQWRGVEAAKEAARKAVALGEPSTAWLQLLMRSAAQVEGPKKAWGFLHDLAAAKPESETMQRMLQEVPPEAPSEDEPVDDQS